ncbi:hypothetical protein V1525DRAFT_405458 [Lipomyces kononenkoae]|uniref:Uncharacterized protein n=1 Tax=Lipomyces kononenkoae TaxID=34357 RepID=A0ACC3SZ91_LIPKO
MVLSRTGMPQTKLLQPASALRASCVALRLCGLPTAGRYVGNGMSASRSRRYYFMLPWVRHRVLDGEGAWHRSTWRRSKDEKAEMQVRTTQFIWRTNGTSKYVDGNVFTKSSDLVSQKGRRRQFRDFMAFDSDYVTDYVLASSLLKSRKQGATPSPQMNVEKAFDESQIPVITTTTTASRQFDKVSRQVPTSTLKQYYATLFATNDRLKPGNMIVDRFINDLLDIDRSVIPAINAVMKNMEPMIKTELVPYAKSDVTAKDSSSASSTQERGKCAATAVATATAPTTTQVDDVTLAGGPLYLAKVRDANKKAKEAVGQQESTSSETNENAEHGSELVAVSKSESSVTSEDISRSSAKFDQRSQDKNIVEEVGMATPPPPCNRSDSDASNECVGFSDDEIPRDWPSSAATGSNASTDSKLPSSNTEQSVTSALEALNMESDQEALRFEENPDTAGYPLSQKDAVKPSEIEHIDEKVLINPSGTAEHEAGTKESLESDVVSSHEWPESSARDLEKKLDSLRADHDSDIKALSNTVAQLVNSPDYALGIQELEETIRDVQKQLDELKKNNDPVSGTPKDTGAAETVSGQKTERRDAEFSEADEPCLPNKRRNWAAFEDKSRDSSVAQEKGVDTLIITPAMHKVRTKIARGFAKQLSQDPEFLTNAFGKLSRREMRRITDLADQGWVIVRVGQDGSLVFQKSPKDKRAVRRAAKLLSGLIVVSGVILTMFVGYGYMMVI